MLNLGWKGAAERRGCSVQMQSCCRCCADVTHVSPNSYMSLNCLQCSYQSSFLQPRKDHALIESGSHLLTLGDWFCILIIRLAQTTPLQTASIICQST
jgi:hypothetical protein